MKQLALLFAAIALTALLPAASHPKNEYEALKLFPKAVFDSIGGVPDAEGLVGSNRGHWYEAGMQRGAMWRLIIAVVGNDPDAADNAWRAVDATFARQLDDGGFLSNRTPSARREPSIADRRTTAFFFIQELAHAILVVRQSPMASRFEERISAILPKLRRAAAFASADREELLRSHRKAVNRVFLAAKAFGFCGIILDDPELRAKAEDLIAVGLEQRDSATGAFLENGGLDSSYNAVSLLITQIILWHMPSEKLAAALPAAMQWQRAKFGADGSVSVAGNSRTGVGKETYMGSAKNVNYNEVALMLCFWGARHGTKDDFAQAVKTIEFARAERRRMAGEK